MKSLLDIVLVLGGLVALVFTVFEFYRFVTSPGEQGHSNYLWMAIGGAVVFCICALGLFLRHMGQEEEIHITGP
jgi:uncharacterized membrane protein